MKLFLIIFFAGCFSFATESQEKDELRVRLRTATKKDYKLSKEPAAEPPKPVYIQEEVPFQILDLAQIKRASASANKTQYEKNKSLDAFATFAKECRSELVESCKKAGQMVKAMSDRENLKKHCLSEPSYCAVLGYSWLSVGRHNEAKTVFKDLCKKKVFLKDSSWIICDEASKIIQLPPDAQTYLELELECQRWASEPETDEPVDASESSLEMSCKQRIHDLENLKIKYKDQDDIIFKLEHPPVL